MARHIWTKRNCGPIKCLQKQRQLPHLLHRTLLRPWKLHQATKCSRLDILSAPCQNYFYACNMHYWADWDHQGHISILQYLQNCCKLFQRSPAWRYKMLGKHLKLVLYVWISQMCLYLQIGHDLMHFDFALASAARALGRWNEAKKYGTAARRRMRIEDPDCPQLKALDIVLAECNQRHH